MTRTIAVANQKGGVGKTTTTLNLGAALAERGRRVLLVDLDPQGSLTLALGLDPDPIQHTLYAALTAVTRGDEPPLDAIRQRTASGLEVLPANIELSQAELDLTREPLGIYALRDTLAQLTPSANAHSVPSPYDYILLDCPPSLGILTANGLAAAHEVIIPLQADYLALKGVDLLLKTIVKIQRRANTGLRVLGIVLTLADLRTVHAREVIEAARSTFGAQTRVFDAIIQANVRVKESPLIGQSILGYAPETNAAQSYRALAQEIES